jgi:probable rRNA maturation factor
MIGATAKRGARKTMKRDPELSSSAIIDLAMPCTKWRRRSPDVAALVRQAAEAALAMAGRKRRRPELSVVLADDETVAALNERWRHRAGPTNVLAFASEERATGAAAPLLLGDVVLAYETVTREAKEQGKPLADHLRHLVIHGVLHLLGYDHIAAGPARRMEALETRILAALGVPDPYRLREPAHG